MVEDPAKVHHLAAMAIDWMRSVIQKHPKQAKQRRLVRVVAAWDSGQERICRGAPHVIVVHGDKDYGFGTEDSALALSYLELLAPALGLGSCWGGYFHSAVNAYAPLFEALDLPGLRSGVGILCLSKGPDHAVGKTDKKGRADEND